MYNYVLMLLLKIITNNYYEHLISLLLSRSWRKSCKNVVEMMMLSVKTYNGNQQTWQNVCSALYFLCTWWKWLNARRGIQILASSCYWRCQSLCNICTVTANCKFVTGREAAAISKCRLSKIKVSTTPGLQCRIGNAFLLHEWVTWLCTTIYMSVQGISCIIV